MRRGVATDGEQRAKTHVVSNPPFSGCAAVPLAASAPSCYRCEGDPTWKHGHASCGARGPSSTLPGRPGGGALRRMHAARSTQHADGAAMREGRTRLWRTPATQVVCRWGREREMRWPAGERGRLQERRVSASPSKITRDVCWSQCETSPGVTVLERAGLVPLFHRAPWRRAASVWQLHLSIAALDRRACVQRHEGGEPWYALPVPPAPGTLLSPYRSSPCYWATGWRARRRRVPAGSPAASCPNGRPSASVRCAVAAEEGRAPKQRLAGVEGQLAGSGISSSGSNSGSNSSSNRSTRSIARGGTARRSAATAAGFAQRATAMLESKLRRHPGCNRGGRDIALRGLTGPCIAFA